MLLSWRKMIWFVYKMEGYCQRFLAAGLTFADKQKKFSDIQHLIVSSCSWENKTSSTHTDGLTIKINLTWHPQTPPCALHISTKSKQNPFFKHTLCLLFSSRAWTRLWWKLFRHLASGPLSLDDNPMQQRLHRPRMEAGSSEPLCQHLQPQPAQLGDEPQVFYHLQLGFENNHISISPLTDSRWGTLPLDKQTMRNRGMPLLTDTGASLNCVWSGLVFVFQTDCRDFLFPNESRLQDKAIQELSTNKEDDTKRPYLSDLRS